jgi:hypothetical protein
MSRARVTALVVGAVVAALAVIAVLLALDVGAWRDAVRDGDADQAAGAPRIEAWDADPRVPGGAAERLLGLDDDLRFRRGVARFSLTRPDLRALPPDELQSAREDALTALTETAADRDEPARAAQAANLAGILTAEGSGDLNGPGREPAAVALDAFRASIALDPGSEHAKRNLERLLRALRAQPRSGGPVRERDGVGRAPGAAGLSPPGEGY